ncbi:SGNH/GDSL hydrolase family protein [Sinomonas sp. G460-2]|uniref:SGNH/GDSL hydrolase family protein n=1 Tax=Sinomonas sp. G460-2 TaxID=3393464 RepID=UPI0039EDF18A
MRTRIKMIGVALLAAGTALLVVAAVMKPAMERATAQSAQASTAVVAPTASGTPTPSSVPTPSSASPTPTPTAATYRFAAVGDAITLADSTDFADGQTGSTSWVTYAASPNLVFSGGWAGAGATTAKIAANVKQLDVDVLVIVAGTNDVTQGVAFAQTTTNLDRIVTTVGARRVVVSAIPPRDADPRPTADFNASLRKLAIQRHWAFIDSAAGVRAGDVYAPGMTLDGVRPTKDAAQIIGKAIAGAIPG